MPEPALRPYSNQFYGRIFSRSRLRDKIGPDNPMFHLLESLCIVSAYTFEDEFLGALDTTNTWTVSNSGGNNAADWVESTALRGGVIVGEAGDADNQDANLFTQNQNWSIDNRPVLLTRLQPRTAITGNKFEVGFADADAAIGQVLVKDTPTSTGADYCVVVRDTDDDTSIDMIVDGTTPTISTSNLVAGTHGVTWTLNTWHNIMVAMNELDEQYFWVNGSLGGSLQSTAAGAGVGPDNDAVLRVWLSTVSRSGDLHPLWCDYIKVIAERVLL